MKKCGVNGNVKGNLITFGRPNACAIHTNVRKALVVIFLRIISSSDTAHQIALVTIERAARLMMRSSTVSNGGGSASTSTGSHCTSKLTIAWIGTLGSIVPRMTSITTTTIIIIIINIIVNIKLLPGASCSIEKKQWSMVTSEEKEKKTAVRLRRQGLLWSPGLRIKPQQKEADGWQYYQMWSPCGQWKPIYR